MDTLLLPFSSRYVVFTTCIVVTALLVLIGIVDHRVIKIVMIPVIIFGGLTLLGIRDLFQTSHSILRNYPITAHVRFLIEEIRPEIRQYVIESDTDGKPFSRNTRAVVYLRAKKIGSISVGTQLDVNDRDFEFINHSIVPKQISKEASRINIGSTSCKLPYSSSILNISALSFGALGSHAIEALNKGARSGEFAHNSGEGGISPYHLKHGGDIVWQIGTGYFGCRDKSGNFCASRFADQACIDEIKMIEIKLSQGGAAGLGAILPAYKVNREIAEFRGVQAYETCVSPASHSTFSTPIGLLEFLSKLRELSGGKPVGLKLCVGYPSEFLAICKAIIKTKIFPDFIVVDGKEGGTGAGTIEFADHIGMPMIGGLMFVQNALVGAGIREEIRLGVSGKIISGYDMARAIALGADWCNSGRGFMFALGCIQSLTCWSNMCPTGVATVDPTRERGLVVDDKALRVANFHRATVSAFLNVLAAAGLDHPSKLRPRHIYKQIAPDRLETYERIYRFLAPGELLRGTDDPRFRDWSITSAERFDSYAL